MNITPVRFNMGLLVEAGDRGGGAPVPGNCSWISLFIFFTAPAMWGTRKVAWVEDSALQILQC